tara:strand:- start:2777 stop:6103 length:3327 start_codon:yes stop_codon:yes gene_type:complete
MADFKNYGQSGVGRDVQLGKQGPRLIGDVSAGTFQFKNLGGALTTVQGADGTNSADFVTKSQLDAASAGSVGTGFTLGTPADGKYFITPNVAGQSGTAIRQSAITSLSSSTTVTEAIDQLNEAMLNVQNDTYVRDVAVTVDTAVGGAPLTSTLTIVTEGTPNRFTIDWGDGSSTVATTDSTPSHTYTDNSNSPFDVVVTAFNNLGAGSGSTASITKTDFITLYTANPVVAFDMFAGSAGGSAVTFVDDGVALYLDNNTTNVNGIADASYQIQWGDSSANSSITDNDFPGGANGARLAHTYATATETEQTFSTKLNMISHSTADPSQVPQEVTKIIKVYDTHTPTVALSSTSGINQEGTSGHPVTFTNNTENTIGSFAAYGIQYQYTWGDGTTTTVNTGTGSAGDTGETINHTYQLSGSQQSSGTAVDYTGYLRVLSEHSSSPFQSANFTVHVEPDVRAAITASAVSSSLNDASGDNIRTVYKGTDLSSTNRAIVTIDNTTQNGDSYVYTFGDGDNSGTINESGSPAGSVAGGNITHDYNSASAGNYTLAFSTSGTPDTTAQTDTDSTTIVVKNVPAAPGALSTKSLTWSTATSEGGRLASGATNNTGVTPPAAGDALTSSTLRRYESGTVQTNLVSNSYNSFTGQLSARVNGTGDGQKSFSSATGETGTFTSLVITSEGDARTEIGNSYPSNFYQVFTARAAKAIGSLAKGIHDVDLSHSTTGDTNKVQLVKDNVTSTPTLNVGGATVTQKTAGSLRYISGIGYYNTGSPEIRVSGLTVNNLVGEAYYDGSQILQFQSGTNYESTSGSAISTSNFGYADIDGSSTMLASGVPIAQTGVGSAYTLGNIDITLKSNAGKAIETIKGRIQNLKGYSSFASDLGTKIQVHTDSPSGFIENAIAVSDSLGATHDDDGIRITGFSGTGDTPTIAGATNFYTSNAWTGAVTVAGTKEAIVRLGTLQHYTTDLSSGYLPVGPDLNTGRSGSQYFTFAFRRTTMANFTVTLSGKISGMFIAAPGTNIDDASTLNGWLDCTSTYAGAGTPGADTGNGGNGSNGCAFTSGDRIVDGTTYSSEDFTFTLGDQNGTGATGNNILVRIKLESGDSLTAVSIA